MCMVIKNNNRNCDKIMIKMMMAILIRIIAIDNILYTWCRTDNVEIQNCMCKDNLSKLKF